MKQMPRFQLMYVILLLFIIMGTTSCLDSKEIDHQLNKSVAIEAFHSRQNIRLVVHETTKFPCRQDPKCKPKFVEDARPTLINSDNDQLEIPFVSGLGIYNTNLNAPFLLPTGEMSTLILIHEGKTITATSTIPDSLEIIENIFYRLDPLNDRLLEGLYLLLDTTILQSSPSGFFVQLIKNAPSQPNFGFILTRDLIASAQKPLNGTFAPSVPNVYFLPHNQIVQSNNGFQDIQLDDEYRVICRHMTNPSLEFLEAFKQAGIDGTFTFNNGLLFAPPESLPTNFDNGAFGFYHTFHEQFEIGVVTK